VAESNRRGDGAAAEHVEDVFDDAIDDDALIEDEQSTRTKTPAKPKTAAKREERKGLLAWLANIPRRIWLFFREVVSELRKVIWPSRKDLLTYTAVVVVFVAIIMSLVGLLDVVYAKGVLYVFGK
jgi:preprotein translocase subunit SecE